MKTTLKTFALLALLCCARLTYAQTYQVINTETSSPAPGLTKTVTTVQEGTNTLDRFRVTRLFKNSQASSRGTLLLLPPLGSGFQNYEVGDGGDYERSFAGFFARRGFDVWGYSQRVQGLTAGQCESGAVDCSPMANWGMQTILDDVAYIRQQIAAAHPGEKPYVGGLSLGSIVTVAAINQNPEAYAGAIMLEGSLYTENPETRAINAGFCAAFDGLLAAGVYYDGQNGPGFKLLSHLAEVAPNDPTPLPGFPPGFTNHRAWVAFMSAPPVGPVTPRPGYYFLKGSVAEDRLFYADEALVHANIAQFVDYTATRTIRDVSCSLAGERTYSNNLESFDGPVLMIAGGHGFGPEMLETKALMTNADVTVNYKEDYGHVDHVFSTNHLQEVEHPVLAWLLRQ
ncbi:MAG TPA: alpha/beta hydrolase [Pyrinomonadaceae bacterium]|nr:alpha/beta hydrolase [Pyrinomonadaceae bacterium]